MKGGGAARGMDSGGGDGSRLLTGLVGRGIQGSRSPSLHMQEAAAQGVSLSYVLYDFGSREDSLLTVGTKIITTPFRFGNVTTENGYITGVEEKPDFKLEIVAGMYCMSPGIMKFIPADTYFGIDQLIKALLRAGERISRFLIEDYWLDIGQVEDYSKAREMFKQTGK